MGDEGTTEGSPVMKKPPPKIIEEGFVKTIYLCKIVILCGQQFVTVSNSLSLRREVLAKLHTVNTHTNTVTSTVVVNIVCHRYISGAAGLLGSTRTCSFANLGCVIFLHIINITNRMKKTKFTRR